MTDGKEDVQRVLTEATDLLGGDATKATVWFHHQLLAGFDGQTAEKLVADGHAAAVLTHLAMLKHGNYA